MDMHKTLTSIACLTALLIAAPGARAEAEGGAAVNLRPVWETGQTSRYRSTTERVTNVEMVGPGGSRESSSVLWVETEMTLEVTDADEAGGGKAEMRIDAIRLTLTHPSGETFEATPKKADGPTEAMQPLLKALDGATFKLTVEPDGEVSRVDGWKAVKNKGGEAGEQLVERDFIESATELIPLTGAPAEAEPAAEWKHDYAWDHEMGELQLDAAFTFTGVEMIEGVPVAMINRESKAKMKLDKSKMPKDGPMTGMKVTEASQSSQVMFDLTRHEVFGLNLDRTLGFRMDMEFAGRKLHQNITQHMNIQVLRLSEE